MNQYVISGAQKTTGADARLELEAATEADARAAAVNEGILITECNLVREDQSVTKPTEMYLREIAMWLRFFGIVTALGVFAVVLKLVMTK